jgi:UDP-glucose 4-epimerase
MDTACGIRKEPMPLNGTDYDTPDGTCVRDYLHIDDIAEAHVLALEKIDTITGVFNLGIGRGYSNREVIQTVEKVTGKPVPVVESPRRQGDPPILVSDSTRARNLLGWTPKYTTLEQMIETMWKYENL